MGLKSSRGSEKYLIRFNVIYNNCEGTGIRLSVNTIWLTDFGPDEKLKSD